MIPLSKGNGNISLQSLNHISELVLYSKYLITSDIFNSNLESLHLGHHVPCSI